MTNVLYLLFFTMKTLLSQNLVAVTAGAVIFSLALIIAAFIVANTDIYIRTLGGDGLANGSLPNTISVDGDGKVYAKPDMVTFSVSASETRNSSEEALNAVNDKMANVQSILKDEGIDGNDIQTSNLSIYTEYDWTESGRKILGQRASQSLEIKLKNIDGDASKAAKIIDRVSTINNIEISSITFDIEDKTEIFTQAREEAYKKAQQKAEELAKLGGVKLLKPISISDSTVDYSASVYKNTAVFEESLNAADSDTSLLTGQLELRSTVSVMYGIE